MEKMDDSHVRLGSSNEPLITVTTGIIEIIDRDELEGVIGHELTHIKNRDIFIGTILGTLAGTVVYIAWVTKYLAVFRLILGNLSLNGFIYSILIAVTVQ